VILCVEWWQQLVGEVPKDWKKADVVTATFRKGKTGSRGLQAS